MNNHKRSSEKSMEANRENSKKSTGPRSDSGKLRSSYNAVKHGLLSKTLKLNALQKVEFRKLASSLVENYSQGSCGMHGHRRHGDELVENENSTSIVVERVGRS